MKQQQMNAAMAAMTEWLAHPQELGQPPLRIECVGSFDLYELCYYIFKYKQDLDDQWLLGVCGGYAEGEFEHCGHVFSEMEEYNAVTADAKARAMVEMIRCYWMERAEQAGPAKDNTGTFVGFVLLADASWDKVQLLDDLKTEWGLSFAAADDNSDDTLVVSVAEMTIAVSLMPAPVPEGEAEQNAQNNYMWEDAVDVAKSHQAHLMVAVLGDDTAVLERGKLFVKILACCSKQQNAIGIYTSGTVFEPRFYEHFAGMIKDDELPIFNWIWFGLYPGDSGVCGYTYGLDVFGKDELEVLDADAQPSDVRDFLADLVAYIIGQDVTLNHGETIGFTADDKHSITRSEGVALPQMTLKVSYNS